MNCVLVNPLWSFRKPLPLNLAELAGHVREGGRHRVSIVDLNIELQDSLLLDDIMDRAVELVHRKKPDIVGITCNTIHVPFCVEFSRAYRKKYRTPIVLGGIHATCDPRRMLTLCGADYLVRGEGEETLRELCDSLEKGTDPSAIKGLSFVRRGKVVHNPDRPLMDDLSRLAFPAFDLLLPYVKSGDPALLEKIYYCASRGCPFHCTFCSANRMWKFQRRKPVERVVEELTYLKTKYKPSLILFGDDCLPLNHAWFGDLLTRIKKMGISWGCLSRVDVVTADLLGRMRESGCRDIYHGLESGSERIRKVLQKGLRPGVDNASIVRLVAEEVRLGIVPTCSFMVGIPTETKAEIEETIGLAAALKQTGAIVQFWIMTPYPDTDAFRRYKDRLIEVDRWKLLRQSDVNSYDQFYLYRGFYEKYRAMNPDRYMFKPAMGMKDFLALYRDGHRRLVGEEESSYFQGKLYDYFEETPKGLYYIGIGEKRRLGGPSRRGPGAGCFLRIRKDFFDHSSRVLERLKARRPAPCFVSLDITRKDMPALRPKIRSFLRALRECNIKFVLTRPGFEAGGAAQTAGRGTPRNCAQCYELFRIAADGEIVLCTGKKLFKTHDALYRSLNYYFFLRLGILEPSRRSSCYHFPKDRNAFMDLMRQYNRSHQVIDLAEESFERGDIDGCLRRIERARRLGCGQERIHALFGFCLERKNQFREAARELALAAKIYPGNGRIRASLHRCRTRVRPGAAA